MLFYFYFLCVLLCKSAVKQQLELGCAVLSNVYCTGGAAKVGGETMSGGSLCVGFEHSVMSQLLSAGVKGVQGGLFTLFTRRHQSGATTTRMADRLTPPRPISCRYTLHLLHP